MKKEGHLSVATDEVFLITPIKILESDATGHYATSVSRATSFGRPVQTLLNDKRSNKKV